MNRAILLALAVAASASSAFADPVTITSGAMSVSCDSASHELVFSRNGKAFADHVKPWDGLGAVSDVKVVQGSDGDNGGKSIELTGANGLEQFSLREGVPFVVARVQVHNTSATPLVVRNIIPFSAPLAGKLTDFFTPSGNGAPADTSAYLFLAAVDTATNAGVVTGWLTHDVGSGIVDARAGDQITIAPRGEYGNWHVAAKATVWSESAAIGDFDDARAGLEAFADANARFNNIHLRAPLSGYCTWYHAHASNEKDLKALADFAKAQKLKDFGFYFVQIDDGWQTARRDFSTFSTEPKATYPAGMRTTADNLTGDGFIAGLWLTPFAWDAKILKDHPEYFVKTADGKPYSVKWAGDCLDMTNPAAVSYLSETIHRITHDWDYKYLKIDGLWAGSATTILYPNPTYMPDDYGNAVFHDAGATNMSAYRAGLRAVRAAAGDDVFICGCNVAQNHRTLGGTIGLVDAMRVGPDINATWASISTRAAVYASREYFLNGRVWWNDPDCLMLRDPLTLDEARAWGSFIAISGQLNVVSEDLAKLPPEKFDIVKRTMPNIPHAARPIDLFTSNPPQVWVADVGTGETARQIVGLFNWGDKAPAKINFDPKALALPADMLAFDYWDNTFADPMSVAQEMAVAPGSCKVFSVVKNLHRPQVVSTSRHVLQGGPDLVDVTWDPATLTLTGKSKLVANDPYELRIGSAGYKLQQHTLDAKSLAGPEKITSDKGTDRVQFTATATGDIPWSLHYTQDK